MSFRGARKSSTLGWLDSEESSSSDENEVEASDQAYFENLLAENQEQQKQASLKEKIQEELTSFFTQGEEDSEIPTELQDKMDDILAQVKDQENAFLKIVEASKFLLSRTKDLTKGLEKRDTKFDKLRSKFANKQEETMNVLREKDYQVQDYQSKREDAEHRADTLQMEVTKRQSIIHVQEKKISEIDSQQQEKTPSYNNESPVKMAKNKKQRTSTLVDYSAQISKVENKNRELEAQMMLQLRNQDEMRNDLDKKQNELDRVKEASAKYKQGNLHYQEQARLKTNIITELEKTLDELTQCMENDKQTMRLKAIEDAKAQEEADQRGNERSYSVMSIDGLAGELSQAAVIQNTTPRASFDSRQDEAEHLGSPEKEFFNDQVVNEIDQFGTENFNDFQAPELDQEQLNQLHDSDSQEENLDDNQNVDQLFQQQKLDSTTPRGSLKKKAISQALQEAYQAEETHAQVSTPKQQRQLTEEELALRNMSSGVLRDRVGTQKSVPSKVFEFKDNQMANVPEMSECSDDSRIIKLDQQGIDEHKNRAFQESFMMGQRANRMETPKSFTSFTSSTTSQGGALRKDPNEEFFKMTLLSFKLNHPETSCLLDSGSSALYQKVKESKKPFYKWPDWIQEHMENLKKLQPNPWPRSISKK